MVGRVGLSLVGACREQAAYMSWVLQEREVSCFSCQRKRRSWFLCPLTSIIRCVYGFLPTGLRLFSSVCLQVDSLERRDSRVVPWQRQSLGTVGRNGADWAGPMCGSGRMQENEDALYWLRGAPAFRRQGGFQCFKVQRACRLWEVLMPNCPSPSTCKRPREVESNGIEFRSSQRPNNVCGGLAKIPSPAAY